MCKRRLLFLFVMAMLGHATQVQAQVCNGPLSVTIAGSGTGLPLSATASSTPVTCNGGNTGTATVLPAGGTLNYTYLWTGGQTGATATGLAAGTYSVTVTDANLCTTTTSTTVSEPPLVVASGTQVNETCFGQSIGSIDLSVVGGSGSYTYLWTPGGATTQDLSGLAAGTYTVSITESNGCTITGTTSFTISQPDLVVASGTQVNETCFGQSIGSIDLSVVGGSGSYTYLWTPGGATTQDLSGLAAGTYTVSITESNGCTITGTTSFTITQPDLIVASGTQVNVSCNGALTGSIDLTVVGGSSSYTYLWSPGGATTQDLSGLAAGTYTVSITESNGCTITGTTSFTITEPTAVTISSATVTSDYNGAHISCAVGQGTSNDGQITVVASGGTGSLQYSNDGGATYQASGVFSGLTAGTFSLVVKDANNCTATASVNVVAPPAIMAGTCTNAQDKCQVSAGQIKVEASGGTGTLNVTWTSVPAGASGSPSGSAQPIPAAPGNFIIYSNLTGGTTYNFVVTDANGCKVP